MTLRICALTNKTLNHRCFVKDTTKHYSDINVNAFDGIKIRVALCCPNTINGFNNLLDDLFHLKRVMI